MILYSVCTTYHLLEAIIHKLLYNKADDSVLMISTWLRDKYPWYEDMERIFVKVMPFEGFYTVEDGIKGRLDKYYSQLFSDYGMEIKQFSEIHLFGAEHSFGAYLALNDVFHCHWEEGAGAFAKAESEQMNVLAANLHGNKKAEFQAEHHLWDGKSEFVKARFYNQYYQDSKIEGENLIHFDVAESLAALKEEDRDQILELFYPYEKLQAPDNSVLLLTENLANINVLTWDEQRLMYQYLKDYFMADAQVLVKPHPMDLMPYSRYFEGWTVIKGVFPAELLPFIFEIQPAAVATGSSTAVYGMRKLFRRVIEFDFDFTHKKRMYDLDRYYVAMKLAKACCKEGYEIRLLGADKKIVKNFNEALNAGLKETDEMTEEELSVQAAPTVWLVDELQNAPAKSRQICEALEMLNEEDVVIFLNTAKDYCFYNYDFRQIWKDITVVDISKSLQKSRHQRSLFTDGTDGLLDKTEQIYIYTRGEYGNMGKMKKELPNVGICLESEACTGEKNKIRVLEGMLEATEQRLLYYIEKEKAEKGDEAL